MLDLPDLLATTAAALRAARSAPVLPPTTVQINAMLEQLPILARRSLSGSDALLLPLTGESEPTARAVVALLSAEGVEARIEGGALVVPVASLLAVVEGQRALTTLEAFRVQWRLEEGGEASAAVEGDRLSVRDGAGSLFCLVPGWEHRPLPDLLAEAQPILTAFRLQWAALAGPTSGAVLNPNAGTLLASVGPHTATLAPGWRSRPATDLVEEARVAFALPRWSLSALAEAWQARCPHAGSSVTLVQGTYPAGGGYRAVPAVAFGGAPGGPIYLDQDDVRDLAVGDVVAMAALQAGLVDQAPSLPLSLDTTRSGRRSLAHRSTTV